MALLLNAGDTVSRSYSYTQPSPLHPSQPQGTGERTGNFFDVSTIEKGRIYNGEVGYVSQTSSLTIEGGTVSFTTTTAYRGVCSGFFEIPEGTETITFNFIRNEALGVKFVFYDNTKIWLNQDYIPTLSDIPPATANVPSGAKYVRLSFTGQISGGYSYAMSNIMLNLGSTPLPYEPWGIEIPISSANTTTNVYLGEVETTRKIKKLVLTGEEECFFSYGSFRLVLSGYLRERGWIPICSHYKGIDFVSGGDILQNGEIAFLLSDSGNNFLYVCDTSISTVTDFKSYLAAQYTAGTPVTVWYVLANEETGIVNEPLMKIGKYADEVSGITIPVTAGGDTLSVDTTVQPSEVSLSYTGWHDAAVKEWDGGQW